MIISVSRIKELLSRLKRVEDSHKGMFGHIGVVSPAVGMEGATSLVCSSAYKVGAGIVSIISLDEKTFSLRARMPMLIPEVKISEFVDFNFTSIVAGPGFGTSRSRLLKRIVKYAPCPLVLDADALNIIANDLEVLSNCNKEAVVMTPHPAEMGRLLNISTNEVQKDRFKAIKTAVDKFGVTFVLKGHKTLIFGPGIELIENPTGNPALSKAGSGDVLSGMIAGYLAQGLSIVDASTLAVYLHGFCADFLVNKKGYSELSVMPTDIIDCCSTIINELPWFDRRFVVVIRTKNQETITTWTY